MESKVVSALFPIFLCFNCNASHLCSFSSAGRKQSFFLKEMKTRTNTCKGKELIWKARSKDADHLLKARSATAGSSFSAGFCSMEARHRQCRQSRVLHCQEHQSYVPTNHCQSGNSACLHIFTPVRISVHDRVLTK